MISLASRAALKVASQRCFHVDARDEIATHRLGAVTRDVDPLAYEALASTPHLLALPVLAVRTRSEVRHVARLVRPEQRVPGIDDRYAILDLDVAVRYWLSVERDQLPVRSPLPDEFGMAGPAVHARARWYVPPILRDRVIASDSVPTVALLPFGYVTTYPRALRLPPQADSDLMGPTFRSRVSE